MAWSLQRSQRGMKNSSLNIMRVQAMSCHPQVIWSVEESARVDFQLLFALLLKIMTIHVHYEKYNHWLYIYVTNCLCTCIKRNHFASTKQLLLKWIVTICFTFYKLFVVRWFFGVLILLILVHSRLFMFIALSAGQCRFSAVPWYW